MKEKAIAKIEAETLTGIGEPIREIVKIWLDYSPEAAALVCAADKSCKDCVKYHTDKARKKAKGGSYNSSPEEEVQWTLEYFGVSEDEAQALVEGGLLYEIKLAELKKRAPYGRDVSEDVRGLKSSAAMVDNSGTSPVVSVDNSSSESRGLDFSLDDLLG